MGFNDNRDWECSVCNSKSCHLVKGATCLYVICDKCESTDEISYIGGGS